MEKIRWCEIADFSETTRMTALSEALTHAGIENEVSFLPATADDFASVLKQAQKDFAQIRISGTLCQLALETFENTPIAVKIIGAADALVREESSSAGGQKTDQKNGQKNGQKYNHWWPRNFLSDGIQRAIVADIKTLNIGSGVFVLGMGWEARSVIAALTRIGFRRFTISDKDERGADEFIRSLQSTHFDVEFSFVPRRMITQLPSVHSFGVNTLVKGRDDGALEELVYFNYLETGGVWLDLPLAPSNDALAEEADAAGAIVEQGIKVAVATDALWAETCFAELRAGSKLKFDRAEYRGLLGKRLRA